MMDVEIFLTMEEAKNAIYLDLESYGVQEESLFEVAHLAGGPWPNRFKEVMGGGEERMDPLIALVGELLNSPTATEAFLCGAFSIMFWGGVRIADDAHGQNGVILSTGLSDFTCLQCGQCCTELDYSNSLIPEDVAMLKDAGRDDILAWVAQDIDDGSYTIWVHPDTGEIQESCPFLLEEEGKQICTIHEFKPSTCREYPATKKHGLMTDCPGVALMMGKTSR